MDAIDIKALKKLADACRKAGIKTFKGHGIEFTLDESFAPASTRSTSATRNNTIAPGEAPKSENTLSEEEMLFWSVGGDMPQAPENTE